MDVGKEIGEALGAILREEEEGEQREKYRAAMAVLRGIPQGTPDSELTEVQRRAWTDHDEALAWLQANR